jgi:hypothetical protein
MAQLKQYEHIVELGKKIADELGLEQSCDTLGRWMSHHIAELIDLAERGPASERAQRQEQCRAAILEVWEHINSIPPVSRPFGDLEPIVATIRALDPNESAYFYQSRAQDVADASKLPDAAKDWLKLSRGLDYTARLLIRMCLDKVMAETSGKFREWIELAADAGATELPVVEIVRMLEGDDEAPKRVNEKRKKELQERLERLQGMKKLSELLENDIQAQLDEIESS